MLDLSLFLKRQLIFDSENCPLHCDQVFIGLNGRAL